MGHVDPLKEVNFNSRPSARGDDGEIWELRPISISIHAPPRGATVGLFASRMIPNFNSRPSARGDTWRSRWTHGRRTISIHAPPRGATAVLVLAGGHDARISIHAPPRGATLPPIWASMPTEISIHAPPRGATNRLHALGWRMNISIHAPPRGATSEAKRSHRQTTISIHAPPRGATTCLLTAFSDRKQFQFTPLREGRRPRLGKASGPHLISIHAPPRGATRR